MEEALPLLFMLLFLQGLQHCKVMHELRRGDTRGVEFHASAIYIQGPLIQIQCPCSHLEINLIT